jgi:hypothetical protein
MMVAGDTMALFRAAQFLEQRPTRRATERWLRRLQDWRGDVRRFYPWPALEASLDADIRALTNYLKEQPR